MHRDGKMYGLKANGAWKMHLLKTRFQPLKSLIASCDLQFLTFVSNRTACPKSIGLIHRPAWTPSRLKVVSFFLEANGKTVIVRDRRHLQSNHLCLCMIKALSEKSKVKCSITSKKNTEGRYLCRKKKEGDRGKIAPSFSEREQASDGQDAP